MHWSYSKWGTFKQCPAKFRYRYFEQLPEEKFRAAERGLLVHKTFEQFLRGEVDKLLPEFDYYTGFMTHLRKMGAATEELWCFDRDWNRIPPDSDNIWLKMVADASVHKPPIGYVYDWKTGKIYPDHLDQRELYALCYFMAHEDVEEVVGFHTYIDLYENRQTTYYRSEIDNLKEKWEGRAFMMFNGEYIPNPSYLCRFCSFSKAKGGPCQY